MIFKKADKLILKQFVGPYVVAFFIVEFVLVMMFMWKYIDDLLGRGYAMTDYLELILLYGVTMMPQAMPLTVLLSSVMVYGDMAEHFELSSLKSAGTSLLRIFRPGLIVAIGTFFLSLSASNYFKPNASKAFLKKFNIMRLSKVTFAFEEKVFNMDFKNYSIYVDKKSKDGKTLNDVLIYYIPQKDKNLLSVISAQKAIMTTSEDGKYLVMDLYEGYSYDERKNPESTANYHVKPDRNLPIYTTSFSRRRIVFELSDIFHDRSGLNIERKKHDILNTLELLDHIDSMNVKITNESISNVYDFREMLNVEKPNVKVDNILGGRTENKEIKPVLKPKRTAFPRLVTTQKLLVDSLIRTQKGMRDIMSVVVLPKDKGEFIKKIKAKNSSLRTATLNNYRKSRTYKVKKQYFLLRLHQQYSWALICILLLFIGAPMGTIVRKGGFGYPMLVAIGFYMLFIVFNIFSERMMTSGTLNGVIAGWFSFLVLLPFAFVISYMALMDIKLSKSFFTRLVPTRFR